MLVSIVIPCRNEEKYISKCLTSIFESNYPTDSLEIIIVDGKSNDKTIEIIHAFINRHKGIKLIENHKQTTQWALNIGIKQANGEVVIILGAHAALGKNYISGCVDFLNNNPNTVCVGGLVKNIYDNEISKIIGVAMSSPFGVGNAHFRTGAKSGYVDTVAFGAYRKDIFDKIGYFDEELVRNQDDEFNYRITKNAYKIYLDTNLQLEYFTRASFKKLFLQYFQYGYWKVYVNKKHKTITTLRQLVPSLFVLFIILGFIASFAGIYIRFLYRLTLLSYIVLAIKSGLNRVETIKELLLYIFSCAILHISYGSGYLWGMITFLLLGKKPSDTSKKLTR